MMKKNSKSAEAQSPAIGFLLELEYMLFPGRQLAFEAYRGILKKHQIDLDETAFARYCLKRNLTLNLKGLLAVLNKKELATEEIASKIAKQLNEAVVAPANRPVNALYDFLRKADEQNIKIGLLSFLPEEDARQLMSRLEFKNAPGLSVIKNESDYLPTPDAWLSLLKTIAVNPRSAFAFINSAYAHRSALVAGMRCVVIPDKFTAWQDFSGADLVLENIPNLKINDLLAILSPASYRK